MNKHFDFSCKKNIVTINPGEYYSSGEDIYISTLLGSCVAVALFDSVLHIGGLNHFMLPSRGAHVKKKEDSGRYGEYAMELLINDLLKKGSKRSALTAKVFGGGNVLTGFSLKLGDVNARFACEYLECERISVLKQDTGGMFSRKVVMHPCSGSVFVRRTKHESDVASQERAYRNTLKEVQAHLGDIVLF